MRAVLALATASVASAISIAGRSPQSARQSEATSFVRSLEFKQTLRVCNAYPYDSGVDIFLGKEELSSKSLPYKSCKEYSPKLRAGDKVDFKVDGSSAGTFTISDLPASDATLLMVIHRHDRMSTAVAFESHVFSSTAGPQVAVIDAFKGSSSSELRIEDVKPGKAPGSEEKKHSFVARSEMLRYNNVVAVNAGVYKVRLQLEKATQDEEELVAVPKENYVILRVGVQAEEGKAYPEELMVFPHSDKKVLEPSAASPLSGLRLWMLSVVALVTLLQCGC